MNVWSTREGVIHLKILHLYIYIQIIKSYTVCLPRTLTRQKAMLCYALFIMIYGSIRQNEKTWIESSYSVVLKSGFEQICIFHIITIFFIGTFFIILSAPKNVGSIPNWMLWLFCLELWVFDIYIKTGNACGSKYLFVNTLRLSSDDLHITGLLAPRKKARPCK